MMSSAQGRTDDREGAGTPAPQPEYVPDPRNDPGYWTARKLLDERRPREREDGSGGLRRLWAICQRCSVERTLDLQTIAATGHGDQPIVGLKLKCKCGGMGRAKLTWANPPRIREDRKGQEGWQVAGRPRTGWFDFATGQKHGGWD